MDEFLKINWSVKDLSVLEQQVQVGFIPEDVVAESQVYKYFQNKSPFVCKVKKKKKQLFDETVYTPGNGFKLETFQKSTLDEWAQEQCLKALKLFQSGKDPSCFTTTEQFSIEIFRKLKPKIIEENSQYESFVQNQWNTWDKKLILNLRSGLISYGRCTWNDKWKKIVLYPQFFKELSTFTLTFNENESLIDFKCVNNILELGTLARFSIPNLKSPCRLKTVTLPSVKPEETEIVYSKLPVSQDQNIDKLLETHNFDIVISASSLKCITDYSDIKRRWMIPVIVKSIATKTEDGSVVEKKVVFVDKPFAQNQISNVDLAYISFKRLLKTNFCQFEAFCYDKKDSKLKEEDKVDCNSAFEEGEYTFNNPRNRHHNTIHHNASYRIWNIKKTNCQNNLMKNRKKTVELNVLIRSKLDACERNEQGALQPVILRPKLEMQLRYGANIPSKAELARDWTSLFFTPFSNLYRVRISPISGEVIYVEKCNIQKIVAEAQTHYQYKPQLGLGILQKVFEEFVQLEPGKYLLQHLPKHEAFVTILKETQPSSPPQNDVFDFHSEYDKVTLEPLPNSWLPIDVNFVLPTFEAINRMPGMFTPREKFDRKKHGKKTKQNKNKGLNKKQKTE